jgi:hypothetical protein
MNATQRAHLLWRKLGQPPNFLVLDSTLSPPVVSAVFRRPWRHEQLVWRRLELPLAELPQEVRRHSLALAILRKDDLPLAAGLLELTADLAPVTFGVKPDGGLVHAGEELAIEQDAVIHASAWPRVILRASREVEITGRLPLSRVRLEVGGPPDRQVIEIRGGDSRMPAPAFFRIAGSSDPVELTIDIEDRYSQADSWLLGLAGSGNLERLEGPPPAAQSCQPPERVAVVFDRTCPDRESWSLARTLALRGELEPDGGRYAKPAPANPAAAPPELNRALREGLAAAIPRVFGEHPILVDGWWFADVASGDLAPPAGVDLPQQGWGALGTAPAGEAGRLFQEASYCPGLDIWDPVGEAALAAVERLSAEPDRRTALVIIGSSPPDVPLSRESPLRRLVDRLQPAASFRRWSSAWDRALELCRHHGIAPVYLFLEHDFGDDRARRDLDAFRDLQVRIREALAACPPLQVIAHPASVEGLLQGLHHAFRLLLERSSGSSTVKILPPREEARG